MEEKERTFLWITLSLIRSQKTHPSDTIASNSRIHILSSLSPVSTQQAWEIIIPHKKQNVHGLL
jgi:hypothetical protein